MVSHRAEANGYALGAGIGVGAVCAVRGTLTPGAPLDRWGRPVTEAVSPEPVLPEASAADAIAAEPVPTATVILEGLPEVWRVETGALVPAGTLRILSPGDATIVGPGAIRVERLPRAGRGLHAIGSVAAPPAFPRGTFLDGRVRAVIAAAGVPRIALRPAFPVGFATVGDELYDSEAAPQGASTGAPQWPDLLGLAVEETIRGLGLLPVPLGILGDAPAGIETALLRSRGRVDVLVIAGGLGDGVTDRTGEALRRMDAEIAVAGRLFGPGTELVLARVHGFDVLALGGRPLAAALLLDAIVRPALRARLGAPRPAWDWSRISWALDLEAPDLEVADPGAPDPGAPGLDAPGGVPTEGDGRSGSGEARATWRAFPAALGASAGKAPRIRAWESPTVFLPTVPGQTGWALLPPEAAGRGPGRGGPRGRGRKVAHYVPAGPQVAGG